MLGLSKPPGSVDVIKRLQDRRRLTIAAGILCSDGILVCADSEEADYSAKYHAQKISAFDDRLVMTGAGTGPYIDMTFDKLRARFCTNWPKDSDHARASVEHIVYNVHTKHLRDVLTADVAANNRLDLAIAVKCTNEELTLIGACGTATYIAATSEWGPMASGMVVVGIGRPLFEYWARLFEIDRLTCEEVSYLSMFLIREVKQSVPGCGGSTVSKSLLKKIPTMRTTGVLSEEMLLGGFPKTTVDMLRHCMNVKTEADDEAFERMLTFYVTGLRSLREAFKQQKNRLNPLSLRKMLETPKVIEKARKDEEDKQK